MRVVGCMQQYDGELTVIGQNTGPKLIAVVLHLVGSNAVVKCEKGVAYDLTDVDVVAVVPVDCLEFECKNLTASLFREKGDRAGAALTVL